MGDIEYPVELTASADDFISRRIIRSGETVEYTNRQITVEVEGGVTVEALYQQGHLIYLSLYTCPAKKRFRRLSYSFFPNIILIMRIKPCFSFSLPETHDPSHQ